MPFTKIGGHPPPLITFMSHCLLHVNHSPTCKSNKLLTPLEVVSGVLGNPLRLCKRGVLSTVVFTKHNLVRRITRRTCGLVPRPYNGGQNLYPIRALFQVRASATARLSCLPVFSAVPLPRCLPARHLVERAPIIEQRVWKYWLTNCGQRSEHISRGASNLSTERSITKCAALLPVSPSSLSS